MTNHVILGDTDSSYVRLDKYAESHGIELNKATAIKLADTIQSTLAGKLPAILRDKFITPSQYMTILEPGREVVGRKLLLKDAKKRYAIHIVDDEGKDVDKLKIMGMETQRSDTPKFIQEFLLECLTQVVKYDAGYDTVKTIVDDFRSTYRAMDPWRRGRPGRVKNINKALANIDEFRQQMQIIGNKKPLVHYMIDAAINTNKLMEIYGEHRWDVIRDGDKVELIYLLDNPEKMKAVAIKVGESYVPEWFKQLPFDVVKMEEKLLDQKLYNVIGEVLEWEFLPDTNYHKDISAVLDDFYD